MIDFWNERKKLKNDYHIKVTCTSCTCTSKCLIQSPKRMFCSSNLGWSSNDLNFLMNHPWKVLYCDKSRFKVYLIRAGSFKNENRYFISLINISPEGDIHDDSVVFITRYTYSLSIYDKIHLASCYNWIPSILIVCS